MRAPSGIDAFLLAMGYSESDIEVVMAMLSIVDDDTKRGCWTDEDLAASAGTTVEHVQTVRDRMIDDGLMSRVEVS